MSCPDSSPPLRSRSRHEGTGLFGDAACALPGTPLARRACRHGDAQSRFCRLYVERSSKRPQRALLAARHLKSERAKLNFGTWSFPRHSGRALVSFAYLPEVLDELRMSFRILDVEVDAQHSQPCGKHLKGIFRQSALIAEPWCVTGHDTPQLPDHDYLPRTRQCIPRITTSPLCSSPWQHSEVRLSGSCSSNVR
jgi:hypothetical protein